MEQKLLIDAASATAATKIEFELVKGDFANNSTPVLRSRGLGTGDSVIIWEDVNSDWQDSGRFLDDGTASNTSLTVNSLGKYAVTIVMATAGPASVQLDYA